MNAPSRPAQAVGWPLLPLPDAEGRLRFPSPEASVRQQVEVVLRTRPGEQLMRPRFGGGLEEFVHEPNLLATRRRIRETVAAALERWEPRLLLDRVEVWEVPDRPTQIRVEIAYRLRRTGAAQQLGFSMSLEG